MKRSLILLVVLAILLTGCQPKVVEVEKVVTKEVPVEVVKEVPAKDITITWLSAENPTKTLYIAQHYRQWTGVNVEAVLTVSPDGGTTNIDAMIAAGEMPNVYSDYAGRTSKFYNKAVAIPVDATKYIPGILELVKNDKREVVAIPYTYWVVGGAIDRDLLEKYPSLYQFVPLNKDGTWKNTDRTWTIAQFEAAAAELRKVGTKDEYGAFFFAESGSGDYWSLMWEKALGANPLYDKNGKLDVAGMASVWAKQREWTDKTFAPDGAAGFSDVFTDEAMVGNKVLVYCSEAQNAMAKYNAACCSFPSVDGSFVPFALAPSCHIVLPSNDAEKQAEAIKFVKWLEETQGKLFVNNWSPRTDLDIEFNYVSRGKALEGAQLEDAKVQVAWTKDMLKKHGVMNIGIGSTAYACIRKLGAAQRGKGLAKGADIPAIVAEFQTLGEECFKQ